MAKYDRVTKDTFGQDVIVETELDLTGQTAVYVRFMKPGTTSWIEKTGSVNGAEADGEIKYTILSGDDLWDTVGEVRVTGRVVTGATKDLKSERSGKIFVVEEGSH